MQLPNISWLEVDSKVSDPSCVSTIDDLEINNLAIEDTRDLLNLPKQYTIYAIFYLFQLLRGLVRCFLYFGTLEKLFIYLSGQWF